MFDSDLGTDEGSVVRRRTFLLTSASALAGAIVWSLRRPSPVQAKAAEGVPEEVTIVEFSDSGRATEDDPRTESGQNGRRVAQAAIPRRFRNHSSGRHRVGLLRRVLEPPRGRSLPLYLL